MKNVKFLSVAAIVAVMFASCEKSDVDNQATEIKTVDVPMNVAASSGESNGALAGVSETANVNRPLTVLDFVDYIKVDHKHRGGNYMNDITYTMIDDGSGENGFVIPSVAVGTNEMTATAPTYAVTEDRPHGIEFGRYPDNTKTAQEIVQMERDRVPHTIFSDYIGYQTIYDTTDPDYDGNVVNFNMDADAGRNISVFQLEQGIFDTHPQARMLITVSVNAPDGTVLFSDNIRYEHGSRNEKVVLYWSESMISVTDATVNFGVYATGYLGNPVNNVNNGAIFNAYTQTMALQNGVSMGCIYTIKEEFIEESVTAINFNFNWEEVDCIDCSEREDIVVGEDPEIVFDLPSECNMVEGTEYVQTMSNNSASRTVTSIGGTDILELANGTGMLSEYIVNGVSYVVAPKTTLQVRTGWSGVISYEIKNIVGQARPTVKRGDVEITSVIDCTTI